MFRTKREVTNVISAVVYCPEDNTVLLVHDKIRNDYWIPSAEMSCSISWKDNLYCFKKKLFSCETYNEKLLRIFKIWTLEKEFFHLIFQISLPKNIKSKCETETEIGVIGWFTCSEVIKLKNSLRSLELLDITHNYLSKTSKKAKTTGEIPSLGALTEVGENDIFITPEYCSDNIYLQLLDSAGMKTPEQYSLYEEFFMHTYPCIYMNIKGFIKAIYRFNFSGNSESLFHAADRWNRGFLTFQDFLILVAVMDPFTIHYGHLIDIRCQYIFRYYNVKKDGKLDYSSLKTLVFDIQREKNSNSSKINFDREFENFARSIGFKSSSLMTYDQFLANVAENKIPDTTFLLRFDQSFKEISGSEFKDAQMSKMPKGIIIPSGPQSTEDVNYSIVLKTTILKPGKCPFEIKDLKLLEVTMTKSFSENYRNELENVIKNSDSFDLDAKLNELVVALKYFTTQISESPIYCGECEFIEKEAFSWGSAYLENLGITLIMICDYLKDILKAEPRLLEIEPPVFVMGDLHGNYHDLICFESTLWPNGVALAPTKLLFLGDYVDRGLHSVEVIMYLFVNKIQNPNKLYLVRGNHEIRDIQKMFTFQRECNLKFGNSLGMCIWKAVNEVFDMMPLAAVIDKKVFCCHGGIPPPWLCPVVSIINSIPCPLENCERQSPLAWTLMWNDPLKRGVTKIPGQELELLANDGFLPNFQRGTAFVFSCDALNRFLLTNNLSHVIRAHEVVKAGFQIQQNGKLLTVFSSSGYCGGNNYAGSVLVADKLLRVFMVHTGIN